MELLIKPIVLIATISSGIIDFRTRKIPNYITIPLILISFLLNILTNNAKMAMLGFVISFILCNIFFILKAMGGGDVKLMIGIATALGTYTYLEILFVASIIGSIWGISVMAKEFNSYLSPEVVGIGYKVSFFKDYLSSRLFKKGEDKVTVPFGTCLAMATIYIMLI